MSEFTPTTFIDGQAPAISAQNLNNIGQGISKNSEDLSTLSTKVSAMSTTLGQLNSQVGSLSQSVSSLSSSVYVLTNIAVPTTTWTNSTTFSGFAYQASIPFQNVTSQYMAIVSFAPSDAMNGNFAPVAVSGANIVIIYAKQKPSTAITIPSIAALKPST